MPSRTSFARVFIRVHVFAMALSVLSGCSVWCAIFGGESCLDDSAKEQLAKLDSERVACKKHVKGVKDWHTSHPNADPKVVREAYKRAADSVDAWVDFVKAKVSGNLRLDSEDKEYARLANAMGGEVSNFQKESRKYQGDVGGSSVSAAAIVEIVKAIWQWISSVEASKKKEFLEALEKRRFDKWE